MSFRFRFRLIPFTAHTIFAGEIAQQTAGSRCVCCVVVVAVSVCLFVAAKTQAKRSSSSEEAVDVQRAAAAAVNTLTHSHTRTHACNVMRRQRRTAAVFERSAAKLSHNCNALAAEFVLHAHTHFSLRQVVV